MVSGVRYMIFRPHLLGYLVGFGEMELVWCWVKKASTHKKDQTTKLKKNQNPTDRRTRASGTPYSKSNLIPVCLGVWEERRESDESEIAVEEAAASGLATTAYPAEVVLSLPVAAWKA